MLSSKLLIYNLLNNTQQVFEFGNVPKLKKPHISESYEMISPEEALLGKAVLLDVREQGEMPQVILDNVQHLPLSILEKESESLDRSAEFRIFCQSGVRSRKAAELLSQKGFGTLKLIRGGAKDLLDEYRRRKAEKASF